MTRPLGTFSHFYLTMYLMTAAAAAALAFGILRRSRRWRLGEGAWRDRLDRPVWRMAQLLGDLLFLRRLRSAGQPWLSHFILVWGMFLFSIATVCLMLQEDFGLPTFSGRWYLFLSFGLDLFAVLLLAAVLALVMRGWRRPAILHRSGSGLLIVFLALLAASGLATEGARLARHPDPWADWSPAGNMLAATLGGFDPSTLDGLYLGLWWAHLVIALLLFSALPFGRLFHPLLAPLTLFLADREGTRALAPIDFTDEKREVFGAGRMEDLHWKRLLDADACLNCGRCELACPAYQSGQPLSPAQVTGTLQKCLQVTARKQGRDENLLLPDGGAEHGLWFCTTCRACETSCPIAVEHVARTIDLRRYRVLTEARFPSELQSSFRALETAGNPWGLPRQERAEWARELRIPHPADAPEAEVHLWIGCAGTFDQRAKRALLALVTLLRQADVSVAAFGSDESCCGDAARRLGNEYLFQQLANQNISLFRRYPRRPVVTACPHCCQTLAGDYASFGGDLEVIHHSVFLARLLHQGRLRPAVTPMPIVYHDSCYLARQQGVINEPRDLLTAACGSAPAELPRRGADTFCCGGGGGRMWLEDRHAAPIRGERVKEILAVEAGQIATACPFCLNMIDDGIKEAGRGAAVHVSDVAEVLAAACSEGKKTAVREDT